MNTLRLTTRTTYLAAPKQFYRCASLNSAIFRGIREDERQQRSFDRRKSEGRGEKRSFDRRDNGDRGDRSSFGRTKPEGRGSFDRPPRREDSRSFDRPRREESGWQRRDSGNEPRGPRQDDSRSFDRSKREDRKDSRPSGRRDAPRALNPELRESESRPQRNNREEPRFNYRPPESSESLNPELRERLPSRRDFWEKGDDRYGEPRTYTVAPRRTIQKVHPDSEWIYGSSVIEAALKAEQRTLYRLYVYAGENRKTQSKDRDILFKNLARKRGVDVQEVTDIGMLDSMSSNRPHNGYVLEASPLRKIPIISLSAVDVDRSHFQFQKAQHDITQAGQTLAEVPQAGQPLAEIPEFLPNRTPDRYPLILMLDELFDPGNLGAVLRSAYYMGCSALLITERNCAPLSPVALKASAGASEFLPILTHVVPPRLIKASQEKGWKFFAAVPPQYAPKDKERHLGVNHQEVKEAQAKGPVVLLMGGEGDGLRHTLSRMCDKYVSIPSAPDVFPGVDSLNVSVAAAVLLQGFIGGGASKQGQKSDDSSSQETLW